MAGGVSAAVSKTAAAPIERIKLLVRAPFPPDLLRDLAGLNFPFRPLCAGPEPGCHACLRPSRYSLQGYR